MIDFTTREFGNDNVMDMAVDNAMPRLAGLLLDMDGPMSFAFVIRFLTNTTYAVGLLLGIRSLSISGSDITVKMDGSLLDLNGNSDLFVDSMSMWAGFGPSRSEVRWINPELN